MEIVLAIAILAFIGLSLLAGGSFAPAGGTGGVGTAPASPEQSGPSGVIMSGSNLSAAEIGQLASSAGFSGPDLITAVSIALAESGGDPNAYNPETAANTPEGYGSYGLWQIYLKAHPEFGGWDLYDPTFNAQAAYSVFLKSGQTFHPWSTFKNGAYLAYVNTVTQEVSA